MNVIQIAQPTSAKERLLDEAEWIAQRLCARAIVADGQATWISRDIQEAIDPLRRPPRAAAISGELFQGTAGIALFLLRMNRIRPNPEISRIGRAALRHALNWATALPGGDAKYYGGRLGVACVAYEQAIHDGETNLLEESRRLLDTCRGAPSRPPYPDMLTGEVGGILAWNALSKAGYEPAEKEVGRLAQEVAAMAGPSLWTPPSEVGPVPLNGLSHGMAGFALGLAAADPEAKTRIGELATQCLEYEAESYDQNGLWPDLRTDKSPLAVPPARWCHGAAGILLGRSLLPATFRTSRVNQDIETAMKLTRDELNTLVRNPSAVQSLCHGFMGVLDCALAAAQQLGSEPVEAELRQLALRQVHRYAKQELDAFAGWPTGRPGYADYGLMWGLAGIGHTLLRLAEPAVPTPLVPAIMAAAAPRSPH